jgi:hypothetical protein
VLEKPVLGVVGQHLVTGARDLWCGRRQHEAGEHVGLPPGVGDPAERHGLPGEDRVRQCGSPMWGTGRDQVAHRAVPTVVFDVEARDQAAHAVRDDQHPFVLGDVRRHPARPPTSPDGLSQRRRVLRDVQPPVVREHEGVEPTLIEQGEDAVVRVEGEPWQADAERSTRPDRARLAKTVPGGQPALPSLRVEHPEGHAVGSPQLPRVQPAHESGEDRVEACRPGQPEQRQDSPGEPAGPQDPPTLPVRDGRIHQGGAHHPRHEDHACPAHRRLPSTSRRP